MYKPVSASEQHLLQRRNDGVIEARRQQKVCLGQRTDLFVLKRSLLGLFDKSFGKQHCKEEPNPSIKASLDFQRVLKPSKRASGRGEIFCLRRKASRAVCCKLQSCLLYDPVM